MSFVKKVATTIGAAALLATTASAATTNLRIQTHFSPETLSGQMAAEFVEDIHAMSGGDIAIEMFYSSSVVKSAETFDAAATGILDCDMTGGAYQTGKNPAFQFTGDLNGGYANPYQQMAWLLHGGGYDALNSLYNQHNMNLSVGGSLVLNRCHQHVQSVALKISKIGNSVHLLVSSL